MAVLDKKIGSYIYYNNLLHRACAPNHVGARRLAFFLQKTHSAFVYGSKTSICFKGIFAYMKKLAFLKPLKYNISYRRSDMPCIFDSFLRGYKKVLYSAVEV